MKLRRSLFAGLVAALVLLAAPAFAQTHNHGLDADLPTTENHDHAYQVIISAIDVIPDPDAMKARWPDIVDRLSQTAHDEGLSRYERLRAVSFLGNYQEPAARQALIRLTADPNDRVRSLAYYTLGIGFLQPGNDDVLTHILDGLNDSSQRVRDDVIRALGFSDAPRAQEALMTLAQSNDQRVQRIAERSLNQR